MAVLQSVITHNFLDRSTNGGLLLGSFIGIALGLGLEVAPGDIGEWTEGMILLPFTVRNDIV